MPISQLAAVFRRRPWPLIAAMSRPSHTPARKQKASVLENAPAWVTPELLESTLDTWQPFYERRLTSTDALEILLRVGQLVEALRQPDD